MQSNSLGKKLFKTGSLIKMKDLNIEKIKQIVLEAAGDNLS